MIAKLIANLSKLAGTDISKNISNMEVTETTMADGSKALKVTIKTDFGSEFVDYADPITFEIL